MSFQLVVVRGPDLGRYYEFRGGKALLGRSSSAHIRLSDPSVSREHCSLDFTSENVRISDLDSAGGTFVNSARVDDVHLRANDEIRVGNSALRFCVTDQSVESTVFLIESETQPSPTRSPSFDEAEIDQ